MIERAAASGPTTVSVLSGDVHHSYAARAELPVPDRARPGAPADLLAGAQQDGVVHPARLPARLVARDAGASREAWAARPGPPPKPLSWERIAGPLFGNTIATLDIDGRPRPGDLRAAAHRGVAGRTRPSGADLVTDTVGHRRPDRRAAPDHRRARPGLPGDPRPPGDRQVVGRLRPGAGAPGAARPARLRDRAGRRGRRPDHLPRGARPRPPARGAGHRAAPGPAGSGSGLRRAAGDGPVPVRARPPPGDHRPGRAQRAGHPQLRAGRVPAGRDHAPLRALPGRPVARRAADGPAGPTTCAEPPECASGTKIGYQPTGTADS